MGWITNMYVTTEYKTFFSYEAQKKLKIVMSNMDKKLNNSVYDNV